MRTHRKRPSRIGRRAGAAFGIAALGAAGICFGTVGAASAAPNTTTIHGDVHLGSTALSGYTVGFYSPLDGKIASTRTASNGSFSLKVPSTDEGYVYAGVDPSARNAVFTFKGRAFVRGVIGKVAPSGVAGVLFQSLTAAEPSGIAGGSTVHFHVQHSGRLTATSSRLKGGGLSVQRLDGAKISAGPASTTGKSTTAPLVPGRYRVVFSGKSPLLSRTRVVTVVSDKTVKLSVPKLVAGGTITGTVDSAGTPVTHAVDVLLQRGSTTVAEKTTSSTGAYSFTGLAAGVYTVTFAKNPVRYDDEGAVNQPTNDSYLPSVRHATIQSSHNTAHLNPTVAPAGRITGGGSPRYGFVVVENADGTAVRGETFRKTGFTVGGLTAGTYTLYYAASTTGRTADTKYTKLTVTVGAGATTDVGTVTPDTPALTLSGTVTGASGGTVDLFEEHEGYRGSSAFSDIGSNGSYSLGGVVPGVYTVETTGTNRVTLDQTITVTDTTSHLDLQSGPLKGFFTAQFTSHGHQAANVFGDAVDTDGDLFGFGPADAFGRVTEVPAAPGTYSFDPVSWNTSDEDYPNGSAPVADGPWWYVVPKNTFTIATSQTTEITVPLTIRH